MQIIIPPKETKNWVQTNTGDYDGVLNMTRNVDLSRKGIVRLSEKLSVIQRYDTTTTFKECMAIAFGDFISAGTFRYWFATTDRLYTMNPDYTSVAVDSTGSSPTLSVYSDMAPFNDSLWVTTASQLCKLTAGTWTVTGLKAFTNTTSPHPIEPIFNNKLAMGDKNKIHTIDSTGTVASDVISIPSNYEILWIRSTADRVFIGTRHLKGLNAKVYEWDGSSANYSYEYEVETTRILSGVIKNGVLFCFTLDGRLIRFNGAGFVTEAALPIYQNQETMYVEGSPINIMKQRGMITNDDEIYISINPQILDKAGGNRRSYYANTPAGVWSYNQDRGLYCKYAFSIEASGTKDYAQYYGTKPGALFKVPEDITIASTSGVYSKLIASYQAIEGDNTAYNAISALYRDTVNGIIRTQKIESYNADETWKAISLKYNNKYSTSTIKVSYKIGDRIGLPFCTGSLEASTATWGSTTTFVPDNISDAVNLQVGDMISVISNGAAGGKISYVSGISVNGFGTYTITITDAIGNSGDKLSFIAETFNFLYKIPTNAPANGHAIIQIPTKNISRAIEVQVEMEGPSAIEIEELIITSDPNIKV